MVVADRPLHRRGRRRAGRRSTTSRCRSSPTCARPRSDRQPIRRELSTNVITTYKVEFGDVDAAFAKAAHVFKTGALAAPRRARIRSRRAALLAEVRGADGGITVHASTQKAHDLAADADHADGLRREPARRRARHRRRLRRQALRLFRGRRRGGGGEAARPLDQMDRGPPRVFHQRGARARPVLAAGDRGRCRRQGARRARQASARHRRLHAAGPEHPLQLDLDDERALRRAGAVDRSHHRHEQQDAGVVGARRRLSAGGVRDGAADRSGRARDEARPRRGAAAQSHPGERRCRTRSR